MIVLLLRWRTEHDSSKRYSKLSVKQLIVGSSPAFPTKKETDCCFSKQIPQLEEELPSEQYVVGSSPILLKTKATSKLSFLNFSSLN
jgi:hypothetical protein